MPYIVTTERPCEECDGQGQRRPARAHMSHEVTDCPACGTAGMERASRRAVATLEDSRHGAADIIEAALGDRVVAAQRALDVHEPAPAICDTYGDLLHDAHALTGSGGTVGPLPDGTIIDVEQVGWHELGRRAEIKFSGPNPSCAEFIDAYNARA